MPACKITDAFIKTLTWGKALKMVEAEHAKRAKHREVENVRLAQEGKEPKPAIEPLKKPVQISFLDRLDRGLSLVLILSYGGAKTFRCLTYRNGKPHSVKIGTYPGLSLKDAKSKARAYWENPQKFAEQSEVGSFKEIANQWLKRHVEPQKLRTTRELRRVLDKYILPRWADRKLFDIRRKDVLDLLEHISDRHGPAQSTACFSVMHRVMSWYERRDENYRSPIIPRMWSTGSKPRSRTLDPAELRAIWIAAEQNGQFGAIVRMCLLTAQRSRKVTTMKWSDLESDIWNIRSEEREKGNAGRLRLPEVALDILKQQPRIAGSDFVFPNSSGGSFSAFNLAKRKFDKQCGITGWTLHDLRRTARSLMSRAGILPHIAERVLGHVIGGVEGIYDRHPYEAEKADALLRLARQIEMIVNPRSGNVVALSKKQGAAPAGAQ